MSDQLRISILPDGTIKIETDTISPANHVSAENLLDAISRLTGGETVRATNPHAHVHAHGHSHTHNTAGH